MKDKISYNKLANDTTVLYCKSDSVTILETIIIVEYLSLGDKFVHKGHVFLHCN